MNTLHLRGRFSSTSINTNIAGVTIYGTRISVTSTAHSDPCAVIVVNVTIDVISMKGQTLFINFKDYLFYYLYI